VARRKLRPQNEVVERCRTLSEELRAALGRLPSDDPAVDLSAETVLASPYVLIGTEDQICDTLVERRERWGISYYVFNDNSIDAVAPIVARLNGT